MIKSVIIMAAISKKPMATDISATTPPASAIASMSMPRSETMAKTRNPAASMRFFLSISLIMGILSRKESKKFIINIQPPFFGTDALRTLHTNT